MRQQIDLDDNKQIYFKSKGQWQALEKLEYGEVLIKVHDGEIKQMEITTKEKY